MNNDRFSEAMDIILGQWKNETCGPMTDQMIQKAIYSNDICIFPFEKELLTGVGYNLCPSGLVISTHTGMPLKVYQKKNQKYVIVQPNDTILISTREYISVSDRVMGTFHSRVSVVSQGFGHISTTLDPTWQGPLLIALNNPSSKKQKLVLEKDGHAQAFATLVLYYLQMSSATEFKRLPNRMDILMQYRAKSTFFRRTLFHKKFQDYDNFINRVSEISRNVLDNSRSYSVLDDAEEIMIQLQHAINQEKRDFLTSVTLLDFIDECKRYLCNYEKNIENATLCKMVSVLGSGLELATNAQFESLCIEDNDYLYALDEYAMMCQRKIREERSGRAWAEAYADIARESQSSMQNIILRICFGDLKTRSKRIVMSILLVAIAVGLIFYFMYLAEHNVTNVHPLIPIVTTLACNFLLNLLIK